MIISNKVHNITAEIKKIILNRGFHKIGITSARDPNKTSFLQEWLNSGFHGNMSWMQTRQTERQNIKSYYAEARSVISVAHNYFTPFKHSDNQKNARISRYAWGKDYHKIIKKKLKEALYEIKQKHPYIDGRICVDTAPVMDKLWAERAGIGWQGKHTNIISREYGSWIFLGEIIINKKLCYDQPAIDYCGSCTACIEACPTNALVQPYLLNATKCISYLTIEFKNEPIPDKYSKNFDNWIFGCDICQDVCPWNKYQKETDEPAYFPETENIKPSLESLEQLDQSQFKKRFEGTPVLRSKWTDFIRNIRAVKR